MAEERNNQQDTGQEQSKIYIDDDWKQQAQAEKEKLAQEAEQKAAERGGARGGAQELPPANFATLVNSLAAQAVMALGGMEDPQTGRRYVDLDLGKHHIDTLEVIQNKTEGNLTDEEAKMLEQALYQTRMIYVQIAQQLTEAAAKQAPPQGGEGGPAPGGAPGGPGPGPQGPRIQTE